MYYDYGWRPYVTVAERRRKAAREMEKLQEEGASGLAGRHRRPHHRQRRFWGKAWCDNLERYSDYENRLPRGRTYVRNGSVVDLQIGPRRGQGYGQRLGDLHGGGEGHAGCQVSMAIHLPPTAAAPSTRLWSFSRDASPKAVMERVCRQGDGLFPFSRTRSNFPAVARTGPRCASMSRRCFTASARGSTLSPNCCFACARSTPARSSPISTRPCRRRAAAALERGSTPTSFRISSASSWLRQPRRPKPRRRRSLRLRPQFLARRAAAPKPSKPAGPLRPAKAQETRIAATQPVRAPRKTKTRAATSAPAKPSSPVKFSPSKTAGAKPAKPTR